MSVLIKDMEKPKSCYEVIDEEYEYCPFVNADDDCVPLLRKGICEVTWADQYSKCPLVEEPERKIELHGDESAIEILSELRSWFSCFDEKEGLAYHALSLAIRAIKENSTAEPERKRGKWIDYSENGFVECPFCHSATNCDGNKDELRYCFSCGAELKGEQE